MVRVKKLDDRSKQVVYLGREPGTKGERLYDPKTGTVHVSRDVVFQENNFWPWEQEGGNDMVKPEYFTIANIFAHREDNLETEHDVLTPIQSQRAGTPESSTPETFTGGSSELSSGPHRFRTMNELYNETEVIDMIDELMLLKVEEPVCYAEAVKEREWQNAIKLEVEAIEKNNTWSLTDLPFEHKAIGLKWVYKLKRDADGNVVKLKARLVAKGYVQRKGIDYEEVFAPVARLETIRLLLALSAREEWEVHHLDVKSAFLNGELLKEVYVTQQEGSVLIIGVYVDDLLVVGSSESEIKHFKKQMSDQFEMSDLGLLSYYQGIEVKQGRSSVILKQIAYAKKILEKEGMAKCNMSRYPMEQKMQLDRDEGGQLVNATEYRSIVGSLRYLTHTRPDISYAVGLVSRFMEAPTTKHQQAVKHILRYIQGTINHGLEYEKTGSKRAVIGFSDSDLASDVVDRRSTGGMCFYLDGNLICWASQKQRVIMLFSCEAEYMAATTAACQSIWLRGLLAELTGQKVGAVMLCVDNRSAIELMKNPVLHGRS